MRQLMAHAAGRDLNLLHRFEQSGLRLWRSAVDLVREDHVCENRSADESHAAPIGTLLQDLDAGDVRRHEVRRELDPLKLQMENLRDRFYEESLGQTRRAGDQAMPAGKERDEDLFDDILLADNDFGQLAFNAIA